MKPIKCPYESCRKEFEKPIVVTNFSFIPKKETYYACPYCLTKIGAITKDCNVTSFTAEMLVEAENGNLEGYCTSPQTIQEQHITEKSREKPETSTVSRRVSVYRVPQAITMEKIENLEKEKAGLLAELDELKKGAAEKIRVLEEEVVALREEAKILKKLTD